MIQKKYAILSYLRSQNFGDEIQSIAARNCVPRVDTEVPREKLKTFSSPTKHVVLMNGWFGRDPENTFPPSPDIIPVYYSFHINSNAHDFFTSPECIAHFKKWQPIGCRDRGTMELLRSKGVDAFYSKCLTLTFPRRQNAPKDGKIFIVDVLAVRLAANIKSNAVIVTHSHEQDHRSSAWKTQQAQDLLNQYREEAKLVITGRLHCALPCQAMGIPVIYLAKCYHKPEYRTSIYADIGGVIYRDALAEIYQCVVKFRLSRLSKVLRYCNFSAYNPLLKMPADTLDCSQEGERMRGELKNIFRQLENVKF